MKNKEYYFKHDYNPTNDPKIVCLLNDFKSLGYALFWRIIEMMHQADNNKLPFKNHIFNSIALQMHTNVEQVKAFVNSCINDYELFKKDDDFFWSERVLRNIEDMNDLSEKRRQAAKKSWENRKIDASALQSKALQCNKNKINKNKINNINIVETSSTFDFSSKLDLMMNDKDKRMPIIATYWKYKKYSFENKEQYSAGIKCELRAAQNLTGYPLEKIKATMYWMNGQDWLDWKLGTTLKYINEDLNKLNQKYEKPTRTFNKS